MNEPVKVSDWSQKYKIALYVFGLFLVAFTAYNIIELLTQIRDYLQILIIRP